MNVDRLERLQRELRQDDGIAPWWTLDGVVALEPVCATTCEHHGGDRCRHTRDPIVYHCRPAVRALGVALVFRDRWRP